MADHFDSPKSLIRHAREDLTDFQAISKKAVTGDGVHVNIVEVDPETGHKTYKVRFTGSIPPRARYIANNILNNLRHALDQAAVAAVEIVTKTSAGLLYFPIASSPKDLTGKLGKFPVELHGIFTSFHPYPSGPGYRGNDFLCTVTKAVGSNKHQVTLSPALDVGPEVFVSQMRVNNAINVSMPPIWDMANNEMVLGTVGSDGEIQYDFKILFHIAFGDTGPMYRQPVIPVLDKFGSIADSIVLGLEAECRRLGLIP